MTSNNALLPSRVSAWSAWLEQTIVRAADDIAQAGRARPRFTAGIRDALSKNPIQHWEADRWSRGVKLRLLRTEAYFFRTSGGKRRALSLFVRNEEGLNVGFRREAITQAATYVSLITDYGFGRERTRFETGFMDVAVTGDRGETWIYAENKAAAATLRRLCGRLETDFRAGVPLLSDEDLERTHDDALMKANHIVRHRPRYFWAIAPTLRRAYRVHHHETGFALEAIADVPAADAFERPSWDI